MKIFKLFLCFAVILAAVVSLVFLSIGGDKRGIEGENSAYYTKCDSVIKAEWAGNSDWSMERFVASKKRLDAYKGELGSSGYSALVVELNSYAVECLLNTAIEEYAKPECSEDKIKGLKRDFDNILKNTNVSKNSENARLFKNLKDLYDKAMKLSRNEFDVKINYKENAEKGKRWTNIDDKIKGFNDERGKIVNNNNYRYIKNIKIIKDNLNNAEHSKKMGRCKKKFAEKLSNEICKSFKSDSEHQVGTDPVEYQDDLEILKGALEDYTKRQNLFLEIYNEYKASFVTNSQKMPQNMDASKNKMAGVMKKYKKQIKDSETLLNNKNLKKK